MALGAAGALLAVATGACTGDGDTTTRPAPAASDSSQGAPDQGATTSRPPAPPVRATVTAERAVNPGIRQGVARTADGAGWILSTNNGLFRVGDGDLEAVRAQAAPAIPAELAAQGYDHVGDVDVDRGILWAPLEREDKQAGRQVVARYDPVTLAFTGAQEVPQHHASFVAAADGVVYSTDSFDDDAVTRYRWDGSTLQPLEPLRMSRKVERIQGGDVADGALWLSTDDADNGLYRVDLATGEVQSIGSVGHVAGEGEGIDATALPSGLLHVLVGDDASIGMWLVDLAVTSTPG